MSKDDEKRRRLMRHMQAAILNETSKRVRSNEELLTLYVQSAAPAEYSDSQVKNIITAARGKILQEIPHTNGRLQYKVEIKNAFFESLAEGWPAIEISEKHFKNPGAIQRLQQQPPRLH